MKRLARALLLSLMIPGVWTGCATTSSSGPGGQVESAGMPSPDTVDTGPTEVAAVEATPKVDHYQEGLELLREGEKNDSYDYQGLLTHFETAGIDTPENAKAHFNAGLAAERLGKTDAAMRYYEAAKVVNPKFTEAIYNLARVYVAQERADKAIDLYVSYLRDNPKDLKARNNLGGVYTLMKNYSEATKELQGVLIIDPKNTQAYRNLAKLYFDQGNYRLSQLLSANAMKLNPKDPGVRNNMGVTYLQLGQEPAAITAFKKAIELDSTNKEANYNLGVIALKSGDYNLALTSFENVLQKYPSFVDARLGLAVALRGTYEMDSSIEEYEKVLTQDPNNYAVLHNMSFACLLAGEEGKAVESFEKATQAGNPDLDATLVLGNTALKSDAFALAKSVFGLLHKKRPNDVPTMFSLAEAMVGNGDKAQALELYAKIDKKAPEDYENLYKLGLVHEKRLKDFDKALQYYERCDKLLTDRERKKQLGDKISQVKADKKRYLEVEIPKQELERMIAETEKLIADQGDKLPADKLEPLKTAVEQAKMIAASEDADMIKEAENYLKNATQGLQ